MNLRRSIFGPLSAAVAMLAMGMTGRAADLRITISGADGPGKVYLQVFGTAQSFNNRTGGVAAEIVTPSKGQATATIRNLAAGRYAVAAFQDAEGTGKLETNLVGMPREPYGFSNDARAALGPPSFERAAFTVPAGGLSVSFRLTR